MAAGLVLLVIIGATSTIVLQSSGLPGSRPRPSAASVWCDAARTTRPVTPGKPGRWAPVAPMRCLPVVGSATQLRDGRVLVAGGSQIRDDRCGRVVGPSAPACQFPTYAAAEIFDPATGAWSPVASMHDPRSRFPATLLADGSVLVTGGGGWGTMDDRLASAERFDPVTGGWTDVGSMQQARAEHGAALLPDGRVLIMGDGEYGDNSEQVLDDSTEIFDTATQSWAAGPRMVAGHNGMTAIELRDGRVLATDGDTSELFDPDSGTWTAVDGPHRGYGAPVVLSDGRVLFSGDEGMGEEAWFTAELFDPISGAWDQVTTPADGLDCAPRDARWPCGGHSGVLLPDGRVLVVGGSAGGVPIFANYHAVSTAAVFDPVTRRWTRINSMSEARVVPAVFVLPNGQVLVVGGNVGDRPTAEVLTLPD